MQQFCYYAIQTYNVIIKISRSWLNVLHTYMTGACSLYGNLSG